MGLYTPSPTMSNVPSLFLSSKAVTTTLKPLSMPTKSSSNISVAPSFNFVSSQDVIDVPTIPRVIIITNRSSDIPSSAQVIFQLTTKRTISSSSSPSLSSIVNTITTNSISSSSTGDLPYERTVESSSIRSSSKSRGSDNGYDNDLFYEQTVEFSSITISNSRESTTNGFYDNNNVNGSSSKKHKNLTFSNVLWTMLLLLPVPKNPSLFGEPSFCLPNHGSPPPLAPPPLSFQIRTTTHRYES